MRAALDLAVRALAAGDVPIGAVVVGPTGTVVGDGFNERELTGDPTAHAEVLALRRAAAAVGEWRLSGHTLVVTLEPCTMCAGAAGLAPGDRVVYAAAHPKAGGGRAPWGGARGPPPDHPAGGGPGGSAASARAALPR